jgi:hypothetical protein
MCVRFTILNLVFPVGVKAPRQWNKGLCKVDPITGLNLVEPTGKGFTKPKELLINK